jgi:hypothetical protein
LKSRQYLLKLKHRTKIHEIVKTVVRQKIQSKKLTNALAAAVEKLNLSQSEAKKPLEILELEIASLHEGNIARYQISLSELNAWSKAK